MLGFNKLSKQSGPDKSTEEVEARAPFQSVKAVIGLFGSAKNDANIHKRSKSSIDERVLEKETQHHLTIKELERLKEQLRNTETSKAQALKDLDLANYTLNTLTSKLEALCDSKQAAIVATEDAKKRLQQLEEERLLNKGVTLVDTVRDQYKATNAEISSVKQDITNIKTEFDAALDGKLAAFHEAADAQHVVQENQQKATQLTQQINELKKELDEVNIISQQAQDEHANLVAEKEARIESCKASREETEKKISSLKEEPGLYEEENSKVKLEETNEAITLLTEQLNSIRASDMEALSSTTSELEQAKKDLQELLMEQNSLTGLIGSLKLNIDKNAASMAHAEELKKKTEAYKQEAQTARLATEETEKKLQIAQTEAKEAKSALNLESIIKLPAEEFEELKKRAEKSKSNTDLKIASAKAKVETIKESEKPVLHKIEESQKENEALNTAILDAIKEAEMADAARDLEEGELRNASIANDKEGSLRIR